MKTPHRLLNIASALILCIFVVSPLLRAQTYTDMHDFNNFDGCCANYPSLLAQGEDGNIYGATTSGGAGDGNVPKLLDFGIAKILDPARAGAETTLARPMTPEYASPEQIRGEPITTASDVYSLGVVLYQLLTGRSPYPGETHSSHELARAVCDTEPGRPSTAVLKSQTVRTGDQVEQVPAEQISSSRESSLAKLHRRLAGDLDNILLMALRKEPQRRYPSVEQFAEDIRRHLALTDF